MKGAGLSAAGVALLGDPATASTSSVDAEEVRALGPGGVVIVLDVNGDPGLDVADAVYFLNYLFGEGPMPAQGIDCVEVPFCPENPACAR